MVQRPPWAAPAGRAARASRPRPTRRVGTIGPSPSSAGGPGSRRGTQPGFQRASSPRLQRCGMSAAATEGALRCAGEDVTRAVEVDALTKRYGDIVAVDASGAEASWAYTAWTSDVALEMWIDVQPELVGLGLAGSLRGHRTEAPRRRVGTGPRRPPRLRAQDPGPRGVRPRWRRGADGSRMTRRPAGRPGRLVRPGDPRFSQVVRTITR